MSIQKLKKISKELDKLSDIEGVAGDLDGVLSNLDIYRVIDRKDRKKFREIVNKILEDNKNKFKQDIENQKEKIKDLVKDMVNTKELK